MSLKDIIKRQFDNQKIIKRSDLRDIGNYDYATVDRELRRLTEKGYISPHTKKNGYIVDYTRNDEETSQEAILSSTEALNDRLSTLISKITPSWDNFGIIRELEHALKAKYDITKKEILKKYDK